VFGSSIARVRRHSQPGYAVIREALKKTGKVGLTQVCMHGREHFGAVAPCGDGLILELMRYGDELREPAIFFENVPAGKPQKDLVDLAVELIGKKSGRLEPTEFKDHYASALRELIEQKRKGMQIRAPREEPAPRGQVISWRP